jgi:hypothetical protein
MAYLSLKFGKVPGGSLRIPFVRGKWQVRVLNTRLCAGSPVAAKPRKCNTKMRLSTNISEVFAHLRLIREIDSRLGARLFREIGEARFRFFRLSRHEISTLMPVESASILGALRTVAKGVIKPPSLDRLTMFSLSCCRVGCDTATASRFCPKRLSPLKRRIIG